MMGNQRQVLKDKLEKELIFRIQETKDVLTQLNKNLESNKQNSLNAKEEIRIVADLIRDLLIQRKKDMIKEVESLHHAQAKPMQDAIKSTYMTLGSLQSTLTNLDTFDQSQLVNLQIPELDRTCVSNNPIPISVSLQCEDLKEDIKQWGNVSADGFQCCMMQDLEESIGSKLSCKLAIRRNSSLASSVRSISEPQVLSMSSTKQPKERKENMTELKNEDGGWWNMGGIEQWLSGASSKRASVDEPSINDFLMVPEFADNLKDIIDHTQDQLEEGSLWNINNLPRDDLSGSSIVCIEKDTEPQAADDLSIWLKPKKVKTKAISPVKDQEAPQFTIPPQIMSTAELSPGKRNSDAINTSFLDFPCLRMDSGSWIRKKKPKTSSSIISKSGSSLGTEDMIPPSYTLPNPFWLKKYR